MTSANVTSPKQNIHASSTGGRPHRIRSTIACLSAFMTVESRRWYGPVRLMRRGHPGHGAAGLTPFRGLVVAPGVGGAERVRIAGQRGSDCDAKRSRCLSSLTLPVVVYPFWEPRKCEACCRSSKVYSGAGSPSSIEQCTKRLDRGPWCLRYSAGRCLGLGFRRERICSHHCRLVTNGDDDRLALVRGPVEQVPAHHGVVGGHATRSRQGPTSRLNSTMMPRPT
jgi:hypothetical protein